LSVQTFQRPEFQRITAQQNSGSPEVELRFCPWLILFIYLTGVGAAKADRNNLNK
jgi:hypothetical protein